MTRATQQQPPILRLEGIVKRFGGALALDGADLIVERGSVHGLVGQNGAGKSTLIKILAGLHPVDGGRIQIDGTEHGALSPAQVARLGISFIHQDRLLVPSFTVGEALFLGRESHLGRSPFLRRREMQRRAAALINHYFGVQLSADALVCELTTAEQQIVQITRALLDNPKILVFDEPTAALVRREADILFSLIRRLKGQGVTILYISHYLAEIEDICDTVTVLRNGKTVARRPIAQAPADEIARLMVARDLGDLYPKRDVALGEAILSVKGLSSGQSYQDVSFDLHRGEILGLTGLLGSGAKQVMRTIFGLEQADAGTITVHGATLHRLTPERATKIGLALVPEDRRKTGVALGLSVAENATLASLGRFARAGFVNRTKERAEVTTLIDKLQIKTASPDLPVGALSGGNQQKVVLAKWLSRKSDIYLLDEPTVGVDIAAKVEIYNLIGDLAARGAGVIVLSADLPELLGIADRIVVMFRGKIRRAFVPSQTTADALLAEATGSKEVLSHAI